MADALERFWVYHREHVVGPYDSEEIQRLPVFNADLPLCPEASLGGPDERWSRAADTPVLSPLFPPAQRTPEGVEPPKVGPGPPDPEKEAVDALGTAQARMEIIDGSLAATQRRLTLRREAYDNLKRELAARGTEASGLEEKIRCMGARMGGFLGMKEEVDQARAALAMSNHRAEELEEHLARLEGQVKEATALAAEASAEAKRRPTPVRERPPRAAVPTPAEKRSRRRERPTGGSTGGAELGLPQAESVDVPDFK